MPNKEVSVIVLALGFLLALPWSCAVGQDTPRLGGALFSHQVDDILSLAG